MNTRNEDSPGGNDSGSLHGLNEGRTIVVAGGTGSVGRVLVRSLLRSSATVAVPSRSPEKLEDLRAHVRTHGDEAFAGEAAPQESAGRLVTIEGDIGDEGEAAGLVQRIAEQAGPIHGAVATLGRFVPAPSLFDASLDDLQQVIDGYLIGHFVAARALIPAIGEGGSYTFINGPLAFRPMSPQAGLVSTVTAAQAMLARVVIEQTESVRVNELVLHTPFGWGEEAERRATVKPDDVGRYVAHLASDRAREIAGRSVHLDSIETLRELVPEG